MSVGQVLMILWRRSWIALLTLLTALVVAATVLEFVPGRYDAVATATIDPGGIDPIARMLGGGDPMGLIQGNLLELVASQRVAADVVKQLNLTANPLVQAQYRKSESFGREGIEEWYGSSLIGHVFPKFGLGSNVLSITYKSGDPKEAALLANAFLAATIDETIAMKAASAEQIVRWFSPQLDAMRKDVEAARAKVQAYQKETNSAAPRESGVDPETGHLMAVTQNLSSAKANLTYLQSRLAGSASDLSSDSSDPGLEELNALKARLRELETSVAANQTLGAKNPKVASMESMIASIRKQIPEATERAREKVRAHLNERIAQIQLLIPSLETEQAAAQKAAIASQARQDRLIELWRDVEFRQAQLNAREKMTEQARLQSKLTLASITVLDKAVPPIAPTFPQPLRVAAVALGAGLALGLTLALLAEMMDRRVRFPADLEFVTSAPMLGVISASKASR